VKLWHYSILILRHLHLLLRSISTFLLSMIEATDGPAHASVATSIGDSKMETRLSEHQEKVRVTSYRAGNITTQFDLDVTPEEFDTALRDAIQPNDRSHRVELPGSIYLISE